MRSGSSSVARGGLRRRAPAAARVEPIAVQPVERVPWVRPIFESSEAILADIGAALASGQVTNDGPLVRELERRFARYLGVEDCVAVASGSAALALALRALGLRGGTVVLPSFTFIATLNAVVAAGLTPRFCDIEPDTWTLSAAHLRALLAADSTVRLVLPVNVFGVPPDLAAIAAAAEAAGVPMLLDNAHGVGSEQAGRRCPVEPLLQTFSFHATKTLPAGEGGAVVARDAGLLDAMRRLRNHGIDRHDPLASTPGLNAKMSELHAAVGLRSLDALDGVLARRRAYATRLRAVLTSDCAGLFTVQHIPDGVRSNFQNLGVLCAADVEVAAVQAALERAGIETRRYFWPPLHQLPELGGGAPLPVTDRVGASVLCLPLHSRMDEAVLQRLESALRRVARELASAG